MEYKKWDRSFNSKVATQCWKLNLIALNIKQVVRCGVCSHGNKITEIVSNLPIK